MMRRLLLMGREKCLGTSDEDQCNEVGLEVKLDFCHNPSNQLGVCHVIWGIPTMT